MVVTKSMPEKFLCSRCNKCLTTLHEFFKVVTSDKQQRFFRDFTNFFKDKYGEENVLSAIVHLDETNPHMHFKPYPYR